MLAPQEELALPMSTDVDIAIIVNTTKRSTPPPLPPLTATESPPSGTWSSSTNDSPSPEQRGFGLHFRETQPPPFDPSSYSSMGSSRQTDVYTDTPPVSTTESNRANPTTSFDPTPINDAYQQPVNQQRPKPHLFSISDHSSLSVPPGTRQIDLQVLKENGTQVTNLVQPSPSSSSPTTPQPFPPAQTARCRQPSAISSTPPDATPVTRETRPTLTNEHTPIAATPAGAAAPSTNDAQLLKFQLHQTQSAHKSLVGRLRQAEARIDELELEAESAHAELAAASELADQLEEEVTLLHERLRELAEENMDMKARLAESELQLSGATIKRTGRASEGSNLFSSISDFRSLRASLTLKPGSPSPEQDPTIGPALRVGFSLQQQVEVMQKAMKDAAKYKAERDVLERKLRDLEVKSEQRNQSLLVQNRQLKMELKCEKEETGKLRRLLIQADAPPGTNPSNTAAIAAQTPPLSPIKVSRVAALAKGGEGNEGETSLMQDHMRQEVWRYAKDLEEQNRRLMEEKMELEVSWLTAANQLHEVDKQLKSCLASKDVLQRALAQLEMRQAANTTSSGGSTAARQRSEHPLPPPPVYSPLTPSLARGLRNTLTALGAAADAAQTQEDVGIRDQVGPGVSLPKRPSFDLPPPYPRTDASS